MKSRIKYLSILIISFILYGNTLFHDYALDDAIVITENHFTICGLKGIKDIFGQEYFSGFFGQKDKKLVAGGRYRPLSMATFAIEWQLFMRSPFKGIPPQLIEKKLNRNQADAFIKPSEKLQKRLTQTIHIEDKKTRLKQQNAFIENTKAFNQQEKSTIINNLRKMQQNRSKLLFFSHLINLLLYALSCIVLLKLLERLFSSKEKTNNWYKSIPFIASLIFLSHPIHTEVVANLKGRDEILSLLGALLALHFSLKYIEEKRISFLFLSFISFTAGVFSKEVAITFLAIVPLSIYYFVNQNKKTKNIIICLIPLILGSIIYFIIRRNIIGGMSFEPVGELMNNSFLGMSVPEKYATIFYTLIIYIKLLIFPHPLTYDYYPYHIPVMSWNNLWPIFSLLIHLAIGIYALIGLKKKTIPSFAILFYFITFSPMSNILFSIGVFMNERFVYAASIGFVIIMAYLFTKKLPVWVKSKNTSIFILGVILTLYSIKTISRNNAWKNDYVLFTTDVKTSVNSAKSNTSAGGKLIEEALKPKNKTVKEKYLKKAIHYLRKAIFIHPTYSDALLLMGNAQWELYQNMDSLFNYYELILERHPKYNKIYTNIFNTTLSSTFDKAENTKQNLKILHKLEKYNPGYFDVNYKLGRIYGRFFNDLEKSVFYLEKASRIKPLNIEVYKDLGVAYGLSGNYTESALALSKAVKLDPDDLTLKLNLAMTYANLKQVDNALNIMDSILVKDLTKKDATTLISLGNLYKGMGYAKKSQECYIKAQKLNPAIFKK